MSTEKPIDALASKLVEKTQRLFTQNAILLDGLKSVSNEVAHLDPLLQLPILKIIQETINKFKQAH